MRAPRPDFCYSDPRALLESRNQWSQSSSIRFPCHVFLRHPVPLGTREYVNVWPVLAKSSGQSACVAALNRQTAIGPSNWGSGSMMHPSFILMSRYVRGLSYTLSIAARCPATVGNSRSKVAAKHLAVHRSQVASRLAAPTEFILA